MRKFVAVVCAVAVALCAGGCSGGSIYSNYRSISDLMVVQTMGFDLADEGVLLSVSSEGGAEPPVRLKSVGRSLTEAQETLQGFSGGSLLFFGHTSYIAIGQGILDSNVTRFFDCIERDAAFRLCIPVFAVSGGSAEALVMGAGSDEHDATQLFHALEQHMRLRGDMHVFSAAEIASALDQNGAALMCAVKAADAAAVDPAAPEGALAIVPDGYIIINKERAVGHVPMELARGVSIIENMMGAVPVVVGNATVQTDDSSCEVTPVFGDGGELTGLKFDATLSVSLAEAEGEFDVTELARELEDMARGWIEQVLALSVTTGCDFLHLGSELEMRHPVALRGAAEHFALVMPELDFDVRVTADLGRSFHLDLTEGGK